MHEHWETHQYLPFVLFFGIRMVIIFIITFESLNKNPLWNHHHFTFCLRYSLTCFLIFFFLSSKLIYYSLFDIKLPFFLQKNYYGKKWKWQTPGHYHHHSFIFVYCRVLFSINKVDFSISPKDFNNSRRFITSQIKILLAFRIPLKDIFF